jgi:A/G-specific adenine glycosylase
LAAADVDEVLAEWAGLGYYSRARNLYACAQQVVNEFAGKFPSDPLLLEQLKGIGRSTAGAIAAFAYHQRAPILDANVKRILARLFAEEGSLQEKAVNDRLWALANSLLPSKPEDMPVYTQALMDFGATWCTSRKPVCLSGEQKCPFLKECQANLSDQVLLFPQKNIKAKSPEFDCDMVLLRSGNSILLQKRPSKAIWGGLWSLPESSWRKKSAPGLSPEQLLKMALPQEKVSGLVKVCKNLKQSESIKHVFTHRRLWMHIWEAGLAKPFEPSATDLKWISLSQLGHYGLPQPIKVLLQKLSLIRGGGLKN